MSTTDKITISKLKGTENYEAWALRITALFTREGLNKAVVTDEDITDDRSRLHLT